MTTPEPVPLSEAEATLGREGGTTSALVLAEPGRLEWQDVAISGVGPGEVLIRSEAVGICGTDHELLDGRMRRGEFPLVLGHEWAGVVVASGGGADAIEAGTRVVGDNVLRQNDDGSVVEVGFERPGGFARYFVTDRRQLRALPDLSAAHACLAEPTAVTSRILDRSRAAAGDAVLVVGAGTLGVIAVALLRARGVEQIGIVGSHPARLRLAEAAGARRHVPGDTGRAGARWDVVIEVSGSTAGIETALAAARRGARIVLAGAYGAAAKVGGIDVVVTKELELAGSNAGEDAWDDAVAALRAGTITPEVLNAHAFAMGDWGTAFEYKAQDPACLKVVLLHERASSAGAGG